MTVVTPDAITRGPGGSSFQRTDDPHAENRAALTPCPMCGESAHAGPEGEHWVQFPHCWSCGFRPGGPTTVSTPVAQSLKPADARAIAAAIADQIRADLGLAPGESIVGVQQTEPAAGPAGGGGDTL